MCLDKKKFSECQYSWEDWTGILTIHQVPTWEERPYSIPTAKLTLPDHFLRGNTENIPLYSQLQSHTKEFISLKKYLWPTKNYSSSDLICKPNNLRMKSMTKRIIWKLLWRQTNTVHAMNSSHSLFTVRPFIHFCYSTMRYMTRVWRSSADVGKQSCNNSFIISWSGFFSGSEKFIRNKCYVW